MQWINGGHGDDDLRVVSLVVPRHDPGSSVPFSGSSIGNSTLPHTERNPLLSVSLYRLTVLRLFRLVLSAITLAAVIGVLGSTAGASTSAYPVTINNCGAGKVTFNRAPARVVTPAPNVTEDLLALGLGNRIVAQYNGALPDSIYQAQYKKINDLPTAAFTAENIVAQRPDLVFAGWGYGYQYGSSVTPQALSHFGIKSLVLVGSCPNDGNTEKPGLVANINSTYQDISNLGKIFNVEAKAKRVIAAMKAQVAEAHAKTEGQPVVTVFLYNNGTEAPGTAAGLSTPNAEISEAGGLNIFAGLDQDFTTVSWEQVLTADPDCIIIKNGSNGGNFGAQEEQFLKTSSTTANLTAVKNNCFFLLNQDQLTPGAANSAAILALAKWLHPKAFGLPADGS
jgi:iron complex transport system substrate-binding protein